jgi:hypothetical protein
MRGDENDRNVETSFDQFSLQLNAAKCPEVGRQE